MNLIMKKTLLILLPLLLISAGCSSPSPQVQLSEASSTAASPAEPFRYDAYAAILSKYVDEKGLVDYAGLQADAELLRAFNQSLGEVAPATFQAWSEADQIAFLINAYNAFTLQSIIDQTPIKASIRDIPGVWRIRQFELAGESKTLDNIEHQTLRKQYQEPRIHAAVNCSAISCPVLRTEPYTGGKLDAQLTEQVQRWLTSPEGLQIDRTNNTVYLSQIFDWFGEDWSAAYATKDGFSGNDKERAVLNFVSQYVSPEDRDYLQKGGYQVKYLDYNWALNQQ
jgi:hypothetical protein